MPNPIDMQAQKDGFAKIRREGTWLQKIVLRQGDKEIVVTPHPGATHTKNIDAGPWEVTYYFMRPPYNGPWELGKGLRVNSGWSRFDDGKANEGDLDFTDAQIWFEYP